ncbi:hypothetical protein BDQ17DRAFT_1428823 [Cyathus striatus]|nr:hypothetical protein BDQ17DRAFT_1428823 [Cyathus striatus]
MRSVFTTILASILCLSQGWVLCEAVSINSTSFNNEAITVAVTDTSSTCADPNLTITYFQGYSHTGTAHTIASLGAFVNEADNAGSFGIQNSIFRAWPAVQPGTVILYELQNSGTAGDVDFMFLQANADGSLPSSTGYTLQSQVIYVYPTQICGSVPLYAMYKDSQTDHYYSIDPTDPARMVQYGYQSQGIVAYVLPLSCGCS